ncbi:hypothetical protein F511_38576 [Dorcoceras hygrometricum]|uniref:Methionyl-tRNA synthetase n=1 Tax=Dorcoceras hygrometricum TaxID=472368 RepID=A0A2Z7BH21_9LAMI|nr:hypothetical protein F511_38576 [Dorcoceras hygrometricum]
MCLLGCNEETDLGRRTAAGSCPYCGGKVQAVEVGSQWRLCCLPICYRLKLKYFCTLCSRRLVLYNTGLVI